MCLGWVRAAVVMAELKLQNVTGGIRRQMRAA
jgi:hypothetical protein